MTAQVDALNQIVTWAEIRDTVVSANKCFAELIDSLNLSTEDKFILTHYPFGMDIVKKSQWLFPLTLEQAVPFNDTRLPNHIKKFLHYDKYPVGLLLKNSAEVYYESSQRVIADKIWRKGILFGVWELFDSQINKNSTLASNVSSGARSIFMLPKISDWVCFNRLKKTFSLEAMPPEKLSQHQPIFQEIISKNIGENALPWHNSILYLTPSIIKKILSPSGEKIQLYFLKNAWDQSYNCRRQFESNIIWEEVLKEISDNKIHVQPKIGSHLKQLLLIKENVFPGMVFSSDESEEIAPINLLREIYLTIYRLKEYAPLFMHPDHINNAKKVYYSLNFPNFFDTHFPTLGTPRLMDEMQLMIQAINKIRQPLNLPTSALNYFHSMANQHDNILHSNQLINLDNNLASYFAKKPQEIFPSNSPFFKGCISINDD